MEDNLSIVIFGGTGSIGTCLAEGFLENRSTTIILVSNNEFELWEAKNKFKEWPHFRYVFCDIRDRNEVEKVFLRFVPDIVINCAALKHVNLCETFPVNAIKTNIIGLENLLFQASSYATARFIQISTDKAVEPISVMGATKLIGERLTLQWNNMLQTACSVIRFGNVLESRGSLLPQVRNDIERHGKIYLTDERMTRYVITQSEVYKFVVKVIENMEGNEIFIPKLEEKFVKDLIDDINREYGGSTFVEIIGKNNAERFSEAMYSQFEEVKDLGWCLKIKY